MRIMTFKTEEFEVNGYKATVLIPENPNGKWIWKTEFFYAFDQAERALFEKGYTRVYYQVSDMYGSVRAIRLMRNFHKELLKRFSFLDEQAILFGFSRGGLYAFNYTLYYPESVSKIYLDAPVLNLKSWPPEGSIEQKQFFEEYNLNKETFESFKDSPINHLQEFFEYKIPTLLVAGDSDKTVPFIDNGGIMSSKAKELDVEIGLILKKGYGHHPHSLEDVEPLMKFVER